MRYRTIGATGIQVSEIGFGCWTMGGPNWSLQSGQSIGWAEVNEDEILAGVRVALEAGVNHWDNADIYGNGKAENRSALHRCAALPDLALEWSCIRFSPPSYSRNLTRIIWVCVARR